VKRVGSSTNSTPSESGEGGQSATQIKAQVEKIAY